MSDAVSRWTLLASLALHVAALTLTLGRTPQAAAQKATLTDFWAGTTFEVPDRVGDLAWASAASDATESSSEINVDGVEPSGLTRSAKGPQSASTSAANATPSANADPGSDPTQVAAAAPRGKTKGAPGHPREARAAASASGASGSAGSNGSASSGVFGAEGAVAGVRDLVRSFVRAIPIVASSDPVWGTLPLGAAGSTDVTLGLNGEGKPFAAEPVESTSPAHLKRLVHKTLSVMGGGRFAPPPSDLPAAEQKLRIAIALTQQEAPAGDEATGGAFALRFEPADAHHVSRAFFTLASGRRVEVSVRQLSLH